MYPFSAIAFDLDNTLIDRDGAFRRLISSWLGEVNESLIDEIVNLDNHGHSSREELFAVLSKEIGAGAELWNRFKSEFPGYFEPDPVVTGVLEALRDDGIALAVLSNGGGKLQRAKMQAAGIDSFFTPSRILISGELGVAKPDARAFQLVCERLGRPAGEILFVGDHPEIDIAGAAAYGMQTCLITHHPGDLTELCAATT
ncbi:MAG: HAD family hydrolase [Verrucomicrobiales bacterium]|nr:HAD family hydrolase [Verrucomicrobiales bacterium]